MWLLTESRRTLRLAVPLMIGQLSQMLMAVTDTLMIGHLGVTELAALTFANSLFYIPFVSGIGLLTAVSVCTSTAIGAHQPAAAKESCRHGLLLAIVTGLVLWLGAMILSTRMDLFGQPSSVTAATTTFYRILMASTIPALASIALKNHADALDRPWPPFWIFLGGVGLNVLLNWLLIFGALGCPRLGFEGAAWATFISRCAILIAMLYWLRRSAGLQGWIPERWWLRPRLSELRKLLNLGMPASLQMLSEVAAFSVAGLLMGHISEQAMAAHQITISLTGTAFMIPLGFSMALTVRVGQSFGAGDHQTLRHVVFSGWLCLIVIAALNAGIFLSQGVTLASCFTDSPTLIPLTASLLAICAAFQLFDSLQVGSASMLRGMHDTRIPALVGFFSYWIIGIPAGIWLAFSCGLGARGVWWGLAIGLACACFTLGARMVFALRAKSGEQGAWSKNEKFHSDL